MNVDEYAKMFQLEDRYWWFVGRRTLALALLQRHAKLEKDRSPILDLGCGTGVVALELSKLGKVTCVDMSPHALAYSSKRGLKTLVRGNGIALPFASDQYHAVVGLDIFEHIEDHVAAFREAYRVLRPGGILILSVPAYRSLWGPHDVALHHFRRYLLSDIKQRLQSEGFHVVQASYSVFLLFPLVVLSRIMDKFKRGPAKAHLPRVPDWLNRSLIALQGVEANLISRLGATLPWGSSVIVVASKSERQTACPSTVSAQEGT